MSANLLIILLILILILIGCAPTTVPTAYQDSFCDGKFNSIEREQLTKKDFEIMDRIQNNKYFAPTFGKIIRPLVTNEKEFKSCPKS